jgi:hypothetical protein
LVQILGNHLYFLHIHLVRGFLFDFPLELLKSGLQKGYLSGQIAVSFVLIHYVLHLLYRNFICQKVLNIAF